MCESVVLDTPSHTTSTACVSGRADPMRAIASSLREWRRPMSHTPRIQATGSSVKWSRGSGALAPHVSQ
ncbi:MAG: hypothetical protein BWY91_01736 [bacterium ADurb.BinA028]|nr:MAG: hypothetical protein BWY91_01736 [bacterium ADurb.BinA028]